MSNKYFNNRDRWRQPQNVESEVTETVDVTETPVVEEEPVAASIVAAKVSGCSKLNVREAPTTSAKVVCEIAAGTRVKIDETESTNDFYRVYLESGIEGYCMKKYISIQQ